MTYKLAENEAKGILRNIKEVAEQKREDKAYMMTLNLPVEAAIAWCDWIQGLIDGAGQAEKAAAHEMAEKVTDF